MHSSAGSARVSTAVLPEPAGASSRTEARIALAALRAASSSRCRASLIGFLRVPGAPGAGARRCGRDRSGDSSRRRPAPDRRCASPARKARINRSMSARQLRCCAPHRRPPARRAGSAFTPGSSSPRRRHAGEAHLASGEVDGRERHHVARRARRDRRAAAGASGRSPYQSGALQAGRSCSRAPRVRPSIASTRSSRRRTRPAAEDELRQVLGRLHRESAGVYARAHTAAGSDPSPAALALERRRQHGEQVELPIGCAACTAAAARTSACSARAACATHCAISASSAPSSSAPSACESRSSLATASAAPRAAAGRAGRTGTPGSACCAGARPEPQLRVGAECAGVLQRQRAACRRAAASAR